MNDNDPSVELHSTSSRSSQGADRKHTQRFRRSANAVRLTADQQRRQAGVMSAGWRALGSRDAMLGFFNTHSDELGGRPLDIAIDSELGFEVIVAKLGSIGASGPGRLSSSEP